jgi:hypothetical protein
LQSRSEGESQQQCQAGPASRPGRHWLG